MTTKSTTSKTSKSTKTDVKEPKEVKEPAVKEVKEPAVKEVKEPAVKESKPKKESKEPKAPKEPKEAPVKEEKVTAEPKPKRAKKEPAHSSGPEEVKEKVSRKREVSRESVEKSFDALMETLNAEITSLRENKTSSKVVSFLRQTLKSVKGLRGDALRLSKTRSKISSRPKNTTGGFLKPVRISADMAKFTGWNVAEPKSRVDVTKFVCNYVKENNLQNPADKRQINPDTKLAKLLNYNKDTDKEKLTYFYLQKLIQPHFTSLEAKTA